MLRQLRILAILCSLCALPALAQPATMGLNEVRTGMKGTGRTVFQGGRIETFQFEVLGIQRNMTPGRSLILFRASGGPLAETGILAGMSGSPCYIDGRLIGAVSIGFPFAKEPIGGITPIGDMLDQLRDLPDTPSSRTPLILPKLEPPKVLKSALTGHMIPASELLGGLGDLQPVELSGSPITPEVQALWQGLPMHNLSAALATGSGTGEASPLEPGGMVAINLCQGDMEMAAAGTITYKDGKRILCFGHQLFNLGQVDLPLWSATVSASLGSYQNSMKLAQPVAQVGALRLDRSTGIAGVLGAEARMVPLRIGLNLGGKRTLNYRFEIMDHPIVTPNLAAIVLAQTLTNNLRGAGFQSLSLMGNIKVANHPAIEIENMVADLNPNRMAAYLGAILQVITMNPWERPVIEGISLTVKAEERLDLTAVAGVRVLKARVKRGEVLPVLVSLQNIQGVKETSTFNLHVPLAARPGKATLLVGDGFSLINADPDERVIDLTGLGDLVRMLNGGMRNNHCYGLLVQAVPGAGLRGSRIEAIPPTVSSMLGADGDASNNRLQRQVISRGVLPLDSEVRGLLSIEVEVE